MKHTLISKLEGWSENHLNQAWKEVILKSLAMALPTYVMSCVRLLAGLCAELESAMTIFWWGEDKNKRKMHWLSWDKLWDKKSSGGLGFRDPSCFNLALFTK